MQPGIVQGPWMEAAVFKKITLQDCRPGSHPGAPAQDRGQQTVCIGSKLREVEEMIDCKELVRKVRDTCILHALSQGTP